MKILKNAEKALKDANININLKPPKTIDPLYIEAKDAFIKITKDTFIMINSLNQLLNDFEKISRISVRIGDGVSSFFADNPQYKLQGQSLSTVGQNIDKLTDNFLKPKLEPYVLQPMRAFQLEVDRIKDVRKHLKVERKNYDALRDKLSKAQQKNKPSNVIREIENEMRAAYQRYAPLNQDFIQSAKKLVSSRPQSLDTPFRNMTNILSQYLGQTLGHMNAFRSTFPPQVFAQQYGATGQDLGANPYASIPQQPLSQPPPFMPSQQMSMQPPMQQTMQQQPYMPPQPQTQVQAPNYPTVPPFQPPPPIPVTPDGKPLISTNESAGSHASKKKQPVAMC